MFKTVMIKNLRFHAFDGSFMDFIYFFMGFLAGFPWWDPAEIPNGLKFNFDPFLELF
jgi:hypothetical protein